jgi:uncharacterized protein YfiM (DUF2279 family)
LKKYILILIFVFPFCVSAQSDNHQTFSLPEKSDIRLVKKDDWFAQDKARHLLGSFVLTGAVAYCCRHKQEWSKENSTVFAAGLTLSMGIGKEMNDLRTREHYFSWKDVVADITGIFLGVILLSWW